MKKQTREPPPAMTDTIFPELDLNLSDCGRNRTVEVIRNRLAAWLRAHPETGGQRLAPVSSLAARLGVARQTVRKAYDMLAAEGMLHRDCRGNGWYPIPFPRQENRCIGILLPLSFPEYCSHTRRWGERNLGFYSGIVTRSAELGLATRPFRLPPPDAPEEETELAVEEAEKSFSGLILFGDRGYCNDPPLRRLLATPGLPKISLDSDFSLDGIDSVSFSADAVARSVMQYFRRFGHRNICVIYPIAYPRECSCSYPMLDRKQVLDPFRRAAREGERILEIRSGRQEFGEIFQGKVAAMLRRPTPPTAFWCRSDLIALELIRVLRQRGLRIPHDISIIGFDDISESARGNPPLTTLRNPTFETGYAAVDLLEQSLRQGSLSGNRSLRLSPQLIERGSVGFARPCGRISSEAETAAFHLPE